LAALFVGSALTSTVQAGVVDGRYDLQYYIDFCRNKGMFATGATNIEVFFKDGTAITNNVIPLMPNMDSYGPFISMFAPSPNRRHAAQPSRAGGTRCASSQKMNGHIINVFPGQGP